LDFFYAGVLAVWIIGIPIALGYALKGWWPKTFRQIWEPGIRPWVYGVFWLPFLMLWFVRLSAEGLWFLAALIVRMLFRFGRWLRGG